MAHPPLLLGHRGAGVSPGIPENTFASFDLALEHGCDGFEFDVRLTDGQRAFLDIEIKVEDLESKVLTALRDHPPERGYVVSSFLPDVVMNLEARSRTVSIGLICETQAQLSRWPTLPVDYVIPHQSLVDNKLVQEVHGAGLKILVWTVNDGEAMLRLAGWAVDGIISDDTDLLMRTLSRSEKRGAGAP